MMLKKRVYMAFDPGDEKVRQNYTVQSKSYDCPFRLFDRTANKAAAEQWSAEARRLISSCECLFVLCGATTNQSKLVAQELQLAQELGKRYYLLRGSRVGPLTRPWNAKPVDEIWTFCWPTIMALLENRVTSPEAVFPD